MAVPPGYIPQTLSDREVDVVKLVVEGLTNREIALELHLSTRTIEAHVATAMRKLQARSRTRLAVLALRDGIVRIAPRRRPMKRAAWPLVAGALLAGGCGDDDKNGTSTATFDDAFVTRIVPHQHTAVEVINAAVRDARRPAVRRLALKMRAMRRRTLPTFDDRLARVVTTTSLPDIGVSAQQAADEVTPQALAATKPLDTAFLTIMTRHDQGALALAQAELRRGRDPAVKAAAQRLAAELTRELARLSRELQALARRGR